MKRLALLFPAVAIPLLTLFSCGKAPAPVVNTEVQRQADDLAVDLRERFDALPKVQVPRAAPKRVKSQTKVVKRKAPPPKKIEDRLPPQQGVICIFPFNMVPNCTPEPAGRMP